MIHPGELWGEPEHGQPDLVVTGGDADLAHALIGSRTGVLVAFNPSEESDIARAIGLRAGAPRQGIALPMDAIQLEDGTLVVNMVILGSAPDRLAWRSRSAKITVRFDGRTSGLAVEGATTVVVATGQWLRGLDLVPRGHPGDGKADVHTYAVERRERKHVHHRLLTGTHVPHPYITIRTCVEVNVQASRELDLEVDGRAKAETATLRAKILPARYRLLI